MTFSTPQELAADIAAELRAHPDHWGTIFYFKGDCGCLVGHIMRRCGQTPRTYDFEDSEVQRHHDAIYDALPLREIERFRSLMSWNDWNGRTVEEVIELCDKVAAQP